jgi:hypothetical protein
MIPLNDDDSIENNTPMTNLQLAEAKYWDHVGPLMVSSQAWNELTNSMMKYYELDIVKKIAAARVIQRYFKKKVLAIFSWRRFMHAHDAGEQKKLASKALSRRRIIAEQAEKATLLQVNALSNSSESVSRRKSVFIASVTSEPGESTETSTNSLRRSLSQSKDQAHQVGYYKNFICISSSL